MPELDLSGVRPEARRIAERAAEVYRRHTWPWLVGLLAHGSAVKGGFIPGCSDIDFQLYLADEAFTAEGELPFALTVAIHRELARIDLAPFSYIQAYARPCHPLPETDRHAVGPIPGAYTLLIGRLPVPETTTDDLRRSARAALARLGPIPDVLRGDRLLESGHHRLEERVRKSCIEAWSTLYHLLTLREPDPIATWCLPKPGVLERLPEDSAPGQAIRAFYAAVRAYYPAERDVDHALDVLMRASEFLRAAREEWHEMETARHTGE